MRLIDADVLVYDLEDALNSVEEDKKELPVFVTYAIKKLIDRQPVLNIPKMRDPDRSTQSGYWFDKGWNACIEEIGTGGK